eukprot:TRINITY_DN33974_c0_g1_i1.p1 TRINITY_DN33974_c0_g1~~TRINITY_DN33974_c0_g1_i1.p1  ORF type:complete len:318 (+),score=55.43 TRINITY_DN33974_c0_g1_i1:51-956(+)
MAVPHAQASSFLLISIWGLNGLCQSAGWPANTKLLQGTTPTTMGLWSTNYQFGGVAASFLAGYLATHYSVMSAFMVPSYVLLGIAAVDVCLLKDADRAVTTKQKNSSTFASVLSPSVIKYAGVYSGVKLIRYSLLFWLPFYLSTVHGYSDDMAAYLSTLVEIGGTFGSVAIGVVSENTRWGKPGACSIFIACLGLVLAVLSMNTPYLPLPVALPLLGFLIYGPDALIVGSIAPELNKTAASTTCAFINGFGSLGAVLQGYLTPYVTEVYSWDALFQLFALISFCASAVTHIPTEGTAKPRD